jgi:branched-subunit amino acid aminotransferase/4-amino-4-deoxychorismate lyase
LKRVVIFNGVLVEDGKVSIDADDEGLCFGLAAFETLRTYKGILFGLEAHLERLGASCISLGFQAPDMDLVASELTHAADLAGGETVVRITVTASGARIVRAQHLALVPSPFRCVTRQFTPPFWLDGGIKHTSRAFSRLAVSSAGVNEVIWVDKNGAMLEGTCSNVLAVSDGVLLTPPVDGRLLPGVTRESLIIAAEHAGVRVKIATILMSDTHDELYVSSTLKELTPVDELDGKPAPGGGPVGVAILSAFHQLINDGSY